MEPNKPQEFKRYATLPQRLLAYNIDITVFIFFVIPCAMLIENDLLLYSISFLFICLYHAIMESSKMQATLGKRMGRLKVVNEQFERISFWQALLRILLKFVSLGLLFGGFFIIYFRKEREGLHDLIIKTRVIEYRKIEAAKIMSK